LEGDAISESELDAAFGELQRRFREGAKERCDYYASDDVSEFLGNLFDCLHVNAEVASWFFAGSTVYLFTLIVFRGYEASGVGIDVGGIWV
jgi:hypothetical protein